jgi:hypothetical protein
MTTSVTVTPAALLPAGHSFRLQVLPGITDLAGNSIAMTSRAFTTTRDATAPTVTHRTPGRYATGVSRTASAKITFSEAIRGYSTRTITVKNTRTGKVVTIKVTYSASTRVLTLSHGTLLARTKYTIALRSGITDAGGNPLVATSWTFTTR